MLACVAGWPKQPGQINARPRKWGLGTVQKQSIPGVLRWPFWGLIHHLPKATLPCWKNIIFDIFLQASPFIYYRFAQEFTATVSQSSSTSCSTSFLARLVSISRYYFIVSLLLLAFLSKRNGAPCNSADYPVFLFFFLSHLNLGACAGFALANCDWLGRTIAFYQVLESN